ncbi:uncharacterized protein LOC127242090 [Andrographis paniculata]|uniref:uncharacterized protein LOC127242090 n=1 Tax=Andrographis paniculata TaxID=175694 RepID=UPI0021E996F7|nr:uncharacterized protein LOC127242090 [Andrographis paniculata]
MEESRNRSEIRTKPRVLCLHGFRSSSKEFEERIRSRWPEKVIGELDLVFVDAPFAAADGESGADAAGYEWFQPNRDFSEFYKFEECLDFLEQYMTKHGPFDGILGFSQGAFLAASLPGIRKNRATFAKIPSIKFFILISAGKFGYGRFGVPKPATNAYDSPIECPSLHIIGESDVHVPKDESEALLYYFIDPTVIYHPEGHVIPQLSGESILKTTLEFIQKIKKLPLGKEG